MNRDKFQTRLCLSASVLVFAACLGTASAGDVVLTSGNTPWAMDGNTTVDNLVISSGKTGYLTANYNTAPTGDLAITWSASPSTSSTGACAFGGCFATADTITVQSGGKIFVDNPWGWQPFQSILNVGGDAEFGIASWGGGTTILMGTSTFTGNLTLDSGVDMYNVNTLQIGQNWQPASVVFGSGTNIVLNGHSLLEMWLPGASTSTVGGTVSGAGSVALHSGKLVINGINTTTLPFTGAFTMDAGAQLMVGDASHATAVFGDPNHTDGSALAINLQTVSGTASVLSGYGKVYATVTNGGIIVPGGTSGTLGTLTVSKYVQTANGVLQVEVSPTGASKLNVLGSATLGGSMVVKIDSGNYGNSVFPILAAGSVSGSFSTVSTTGTVSGAIVALQSTATGYNIVTEKASSSQVIGHMVTANRYDIYAFTSSLYDVMNGGPAGKTTVWMTPTGRFDNIGRDGVGYGLSSFGISGGVQHSSSWKNSVVGIALSYDHASMDVKGETTKAHSNTVNFAVYGGADVQYARIEGAVFYNTYDAATERTLPSYGVASGTPNGYGWGATLQVSRGLFNDLVVPFVRGTFAHVVQDGTTEAGVTTFDLKYDRIHANTFVGDLGVRVNVLPSTLPARVQLMAAIRHDFSDPGETTEGSFASLSGSSFTYHWRGDSGNTILVGANATKNVLDNVQVFARVGGEFSQVRRSVNFGIGAKYNF